MKQIHFCDLASELLTPTAELCQELGMEVSPSGGIPVYTRVGDVLAVEHHGNGIRITYRRRNEWFRALTYLPDLLENGNETCQTGKYQMLCYMADCSRNAVLNLCSAKRMIRYLASMGYDSMMLYTEDTFELPEYPYFGHMRGRFSTDELKELDRYAESFGIELIPCVQTLAHLATALRWPDFKGYCDTDDILMVGDERTYRFVEAVLRQCAACFHSRRINIGMDEAHLIACGEYLQQNGYRKPSEVMLEHLNRVAELCRRAGFRPMMWSDMFFRMAFHDAYYVREGSLPEDVVGKVPDGVELIYWDYYSKDRELFAHMLDCHAQFRNRILFAGGAWKWSGFGAHNAFSLRSTEMQLTVCEEKGIDSVIITSWGDDGGEASQFSALASILYFAERCYCNRVDQEHLERRSRQCFGTSFEVLMAFDLPDSLPETVLGAATSPKNPCRYLLYNDPLERLADRHMNRETVASSYAENARRLLALADDPHFGYALKTLGELCRVLTRKCDLGWRISEAYSAEDRPALAQIANTEIPEILEDLNRFLSAYRRQWYQENKPFGFSAQELRIGGLSERLRSVRERLNAFLEHQIPAIEELNEPVLPIKPSADGNYISCETWHSIVAPGVL